MRNICKETEFHLVDLFYPFFFVFLLSQRISQRFTCGSHSPKTVNNTCHYYEIQQESPDCSEPRAMYCNVKRYFTVFSVVLLISRFTYSQDIVTGSKIRIAYPHLIGGNPFLIKTIQFVLIPDILL